MLLNQLMSPVKGPSLPSKSRTRAMKTTLTTFLPAWLVICEAVIVSLVYRCEDKSKRR